MSKFWAYLKTKQFRANLLLAIGTVVVIAMIAFFSLSFYTRHGTGIPVPQLKGMLNKPFDKEAELQQMKAELSALEREIAQQIKAKQELQQQAEQPEINQLAAEGKNETVQVTLTKDSEGKSPVEQWIAQTKADVHALKERPHQVTKKSKGVKI